VLPACLVGNYILGKNYPGICAERHKIGESFLVSSKAWKIIWRASRQCIRGQRVFGEGKDDSITDFLSADRLFKSWMCPMYTATMSGKVIGRFHGLISRSAGVEPCPLEREVFCFVMRCSSLDWRR
jgi:hypothetical protein